MKIHPVAIIDSREQEPYEFSNLPSQRGSLATGDYSVVGLEHRIGLERKSLPDLVACCGHGRERFVRELERLQGLRFRAVIVEATLAEIEAGQWRSRLKPNHVLGAIASWSTKYSLPFFFAGGHVQAGRFAERWLYQAARHIALEYAAAVGVMENAA